jgi:hypothetical protein
MFLSAKTHTHHINPSPEHLTHNTILPQQSTHQCAIAKAEPSPQHNSISNHILKIVNSIPPYFSAKTF